MLAPQASGYAKRYIRAAAGKPKRRLKRWRSEEAGFRLRRQNTGLNMEFRLP